MKDDQLKESHLRFRPNGPDTPVFRILLPFVLVLTRHIRQGCESLP